MKTENKQPSNVSEPVSVSVEESLEAFLTKSAEELSEFIPTQEVHKDGGRKAANWQKQQDKELIRELLDIVNAMRLVGKVKKLDTIMTETYLKMESAITKANNYLNQ